MLNDKIFEKDKQIQDLQSLLNDENLKFNFDNSRIIRFENGMRIIERYEGNIKYYFNAETKERYDEKEVEMLMKKFKYK